MFLANILKLPVSKATSFSKWHCVSCCSEGWQSTLSAMQTVDSSSEDVVVSRAVVFDAVDLLVFSGPRHDSIYDLCRGQTLAHSKRPRGRCVHNTSALIP